MKRNKEYAQPNSFCTLPNNLHKLFLPYLFQLTVDELRTNYEKERDNLKSMMPEPAQDDAVVTGIMYFHSNDLLLTSVHV